jgi:site-specific DNA recombinase
MRETVRAAWYCRTSRDREGEARGVRRQEEDPRRLASWRGAEVAYVLTDNDLSGEGKVRRPAFERLIELVDAREVDLVLAADVDRQLRGFGPYVALYDACERVGMVVAWLGGEGNFKTGTGLLELDIRASFAREELRKIRSRTRRKHLEPV